MVSGARLGRLVRKELRQMFRDMRLRGMIVGQIKLSLRQQKDNSKSGEL
mgnify:CR=1 FL=1